MAKAGIKVALHSNGPKGTGIDYDNFLQHNGEYLSLAPSKRARLFDDFLGDVIADQWSAAQGTDGQGAIAVVVAGAIGGAVRLTSGDTVTVAESASILTHGLNWKSSLGGLVFEARVTPVTSVANVAYFIGLTDVLGTTTIEEAITLSGTTFTTNATDAVGFVYDTAATTDVWYGKGVANDVDSATVTTAVAPVAGTPVVLRIEVNPAGAATFFINGAAQGTITGAVTPSIALTPIVSVMARTTTVKPIDVDYIFVESDRV